MVRRLLGSLVLSACAAPSAPTGPVPPIPASPASTQGRVTQPTSTPEPPRSAFAAQLAALESWLARRPAVERVASWGRGDRFLWVRDDTGSTWCWKHEHCWTTTDRPELLSVLMAAEGTYSPNILRLAWGPENGRLSVWEFDLDAQRRRRLGEVVARSPDPRPYWWATQAELSVPGKRWTMRATAPPDFSWLGLEPHGRPDAPAAWSASAAPPWAALLAELEIWPYRSLTGAVAVAVTPREGPEVGVCARLDRWRCSLLGRPARPVYKRAPVRAELVGASTIAVELAELDELKFAGAELDEMEHGWFSARAEVHVLAVDANAGQLRSLGAWTVGGATGTVASLGMYRSVVDLDYRFVRRAYQAWGVAGGCVRVEALRGEDVALDDDFEPLSKLLVNEWRREVGPLPKPSEPVSVAPDLARAVVAKVAILEPGQHAVDPATDPEGRWQVAGGELFRDVSAGCGP